MGYLGGPKIGKKSHRLLWMVPKRPKSVICQKMVIFEHVNDHVLVGSKKDVNIFRS